MTLVDVILKVLMLTTLVGANVLVLMLIAMLIKDWRNLDE